jgi:hypothetical protein
MGMDTQTPDTIIDALGGTAEVARLCDISSQAVSQWRTNGIPRAQMKYLRAVRPEAFATIGSQLPTRSAA